MTIEQQQNDLERREQEELKASLRIAAYADYHIKRDQLAGWPSPGLPRYERKFIGYGEDRQPVYELVRIT